VNKRRRDRSLGASESGVTLADIRSVIEEELEWVGDEHRRCRSLIHDAVARLSDAFVRMRECGLASDSENAERAEAFRQASAEAITALQFEDIAAQGLRGAERDIEHLKELLAELDSASPSRDRIAEILRRHRRTRDERRNRDEQDDMSDHDIDLF
jgi:hypothetical protein